MKLTLVRKQTQAQLELTHFSGSKPGMHRLRDGDLSLLLLAVEHRSTPFFAHRFSIPLHCHSVPQNLHMQKGPSFAVSTHRGSCASSAVQSHSFRFECGASKNHVLLTPGLLYREVRMVYARVYSSFNHLASLPKSGYYREGRESPPGPLTTSKIDSVFDSLTDE
jgi:hypothetical protein